jgi:periplasmic copper chaperone A
MTTLTTRAGIAGLMFLVAVATAAYPMASAQGKEPSVVEAWVAAPVAGATSAAAYVEVNNPTMYEIFIVKAAADGVAGKVELRGAAKGGDAPMVTEFPVPAYGSTSAAAGQPHLRLLELSKPLKAGDTVNLTLTTETGVVMKVAAPVRAQ